MHTPISLVKKGTFYFLPWSWPEALAAPHLDTNASAMCEWGVWLLGNLSGMCQLAPPTEGPSPLRAPLGHVANSSIIHLARPNGNVAASLHTEQRNENSQADPLPHTSLPLELTGRNDSWLSETRAYSLGQSPITYFWPLISCIVSNWTHL